MEGLSALPEPGTAGIGSLDALIAYLRESGLSLGEGAGSVLAGIGALLDPRYGWSGREAADRPGRELLQGILQAPMVVGAPLMPALPMLSGARAAGMRYNLAHGKDSKTPGPQGAAVGPTEHLSSAQSPDQRPLVDDPRLGAIDRDDVRDVRGRDSGGGGPDRLIDPEGRGLTAATVVGRRVAGGPDVPLSLEEARRVIGDLGAELAYVPSSALPRLLRGGRAVGETIANGEPATRQWVNIDKTLSDAEWLHRHEGGHVIDNVTLARRGLGGGLRRSAVTSSAETRPMTWMAEGLKSRYLNDPAELTADAIQAYMTNPERLKRVHPAVAKWIRDSVNAHPTVSKTIQFNQIAPYVLGGAGIGSLGFSEDEP